MSKTHQNNPNQSNCLVLPQQKTPERPGMTGLFHSFFLGLKSHSCTPPIRRQGNCISFALQPQHTQLLGQRGNFRKERSTLVVQYKKRMKYIQEARKTKWQTAGCFWGSLNQSARTQKLTRGQADKNNPAEC